MDFDDSGSPGRFFTSLVRELKSLSMSNIEYFKDGKNSHHAKFHVAFCLLFEYLDLGIEPCFREISLRVHEFDASPTEKGNGYRSLLRIVQKCCLHLLQISRHISTNRESVLFRRAFYMKELEAYVAMLGQLRACLYYAQKLMTYCQAGQLFADEDTLDDAVAEQLMSDVEMLSQDCFYGRCLGFQFCESMQRPLSVLAIVMASFSEGYQENSQIMKVATSVFNSGKYIINPDLRAQQVVNVTRTADIQFCKAFWGITETNIMHQLPSMVCPAVQVDEVFHLGPDAFDMPSADGSEDITIVPPCAHTGPAPVQVRLISYHLRDGQEQHLKSIKSPSSRSPPAKAPKSTALVVHCHGGGFVAQSSRSHEVYLRHWAKELDVPILSIDYSLAPESPFPRALEECFYVYAWAVHNCHKLGSTGEVIVLAGDSAGANLVITTAMRAASFDIRSPDGILGVYPSVLVRYTPSPARLLSLMDPLLPAGILSRCLAAYAGVSDEVSSQLAASVSCHIESSAATLRMSAQESKESDWVVISQDSAASTRTSLASHKPSPTDHSAGAWSGDVDQQDGAEEELEIFSQPKMKNGGGGGGSSLLGSVVSGATDKLASYVGSYSNRLAKRFTFSAPQTPEQVPMVPIRKNSQSELSDDASARLIRGYSSSIDHSPPSSSFHTPMATPSEEKVACSALSSDGSVKVDTFGNNDITSEIGALTEINLEDQDVFSLISQNESVRQQSMLPEANCDQTPSNTDLELTVNGGIYEEQVPVCEDPAAFSIMDLNSVEDSEGQDCVMPSLDADMAKMLIQELDNSAAGNSNPSSLLSTPSDDIDSFDILQPDQSLMDGVLSSSPCDRKPGKTPPAESDSSPSLSYKSPLLEVQSAIAESHPSPRQGSAKTDDKDGEAGREETQGSKAGEEDSHVTDQPVSSSDCPGQISDPPVDVDSIHNQSLPAHGCPASAETYADPLLSPDSGCLSDEVDRLEPLAVSNSRVSAGEISSRPSPSRDNLHLNLRRTTSNSSMPRSASLPVLRGDSVSSRLHSMSPSDFKRERHLAQSPLKAIRNIPIVKNPYMSPLLAPDWLLEGLPHISLVACHLDPLLDDSVMFTRRMRSLGKSVDLMLLDDLPHGFLNFSLTSRDAKHASDLCLGKLRQLLRLDAK